MSYSGRRAVVVGATTAYEDAGQGVAVVIAGVVVALSVALIATGLIGQAVFVAMRATAWPLWYPVGQLVGLTGLDGWDVAGALDTLGELASSLVAGGMVTLGAVGLLVLLLDLLGPVRLVPDRIVGQVVSSGRLRFRVIGLVIAVFLVWSGYAVFLLLFPV